MKIQVKSFLQTVFFLIAAVAPITSQAATLVWDPSPTPDIAGYNVYYKKNTPTFPFDGSDLLEGASPIKVDGTSLSVSLPEDDSMYYFTVTAFNETGSESSYSNIVATDWFPDLIAPTDNATINTVATFTWNRPPAYFKPSTYIVSFKLLYGTDPSLDINGMTATANSSWPTNPSNLNLLMTIAILLLLLTSIRASQRRLSWHPIRVCLCIGVFALQVGCGGGGGGSDSDSVNSTTTPSTTIPSTDSPNSSAMFTEVIPVINSTEYEIDDLLPNTQYYWKVIAVDNNDLTYESVTQRFRTLAD